MSTAPQNFLGSESADYSINEFTGCRVTCRNCGQAAPFEGFDTCKACSVAIALVEQPDYLEFAKRTFTDTRYAAWLEELEIEWVRQSSALVACGQQVAA